VLARAQKSCHSLPAYCIARTKLAGLADLAAHLSHRRYRSPPVFFDPTISLLLLLLLLL